MSQNYANLFKNKVNLVKIISPPISTTITIYDWLPLHAVIVHLALYISVVFYILRQSELNFQDKNSAKTGCRKIMQINLELNSTCMNQFFLFINITFFN